MTPEEGAMSQSIPDPAWLITAAAHLFDVVGLGGLALAWRAGGRVARVEHELAAQKDLNTEFKAAIAAAGAETALVRERLGALATRDQVDGLIRDVREDIRSLRRE
jgi:hypothetical protein